MRDAAVGVEDGIEAVLPALVGKPELGGPLIGDEAVAIAPPASSIHSAAATQRRPQPVDERHVAGAVGIGAGEIDVERRRIDAAIVAAEGQLAQHRHLALAGLVHDLARLRIAERRCLRRLMLREESQHAARQAWIEPQHLQRRDHAVAAERRREPGNAGIGVGSGRELGGQQRDIGASARRPNR